MKYFARNGKGVDLFYLEFYHSVDGNIFIDSSLPEIVFTYDDVVRLIRSVLKQKYGTSYFEINVQNLLNVIKTKTELIRYYFQEVELCADGTFNREQSDVMCELIAEKDAEFFQPCSIENNPFLFRYVYRLINIFDGNGLMECSQSYYLQNLISEFQVKSIEQEENHYNYKVIYLQNGAMNDRLYVKYVDKMPVEFYLYRKSEQVSESF